MPIALDPNQTVDIVLTLEKSLPNPPSFTARYLTVADSKKYKQLITTAANQTDDNEATKTLVEAFKVAITGWKNIAVAFCHEVETWEKVLTIEELWELALSVRREIQLSEQQKKTSLLQLVKAGDKAANT